LSWCSISNKVQVAMKIIALQPKHQISQQRQGDHV
jgi:hypothetical protein